MPGKRRRPGVTGTPGAALVVAFVLFLQTPAFAGDVKVVRGVVRTVSGSHLFLDGRSVDMSGAKILDPWGNALPAAKIAQGAKAELVYRRGTLEAIYVYGPTTE